MRQKAGILLLRGRQIDQCDKFAAKCLSTPRFQHWFLLKMKRTSQRAAKCPEKFREEEVKCNRLYNSPFLYFRMRLNEKLGKSYALEMRNIASCMSG